MNPSYAELPRPDASTHALQPGYDDVDNDEYGTLIFDGCGRICGSGAAADRLFGTGRDRITGRLISEFIPAIQFGKSSPDCRARSLAALCEKDDWQQFSAVDSLGRSFAVASRLSRRTTNGQDVFVLNFHHPRQAQFS